MEFDVIITMILFLGSGFYSLKIEDELWSNSNLTSKYEKTLVKAFLLSIIILFINFIVVNIYYENQINTIDKLISKFESFKFLFCYVILTFFTGFLSLIIYRLINVALLKVNNYLLNKYYELIHTESKKEIKTQKTFERTLYPNIWSSVLSDKELLGNQFNVFCIEQNGEKSYGHIAERPMLNSNDKDIKLVHTDALSVYMNDSEFIKKYVKSKRFEYFNLENNFKIICFELEDNAFIKFNSVDEECTESIALSSN